MRWWIMAAAAVGCVGAPPGDDGGQFGEESGSGCVESGRTALALDEVSPIGVSPQQVLDLVGGARSFAFPWSDGTTTNLAFEVVPTGTYAYVEQEVEPSGAGTMATEMAPWCPNEVAVEARVTFATDDGVFDESLQDDVLASAADAATLYDSLEGLTGTFDPWDYAPAGNHYDDVRAWLDVTFDPVGVHGAVQGQGSGTDGDVAYAENLAIATFGDASE